MSDRATDIELYAKRRIGTVLRGKYRLDHLLGVGGMAVVYKATHRNQAEFAVKMLHPELSIRQDVCTRFLREGYAANSVKHPGAVLVVDDDVAEDGAAFLVMELLRGEGVESLWEKARRLHPRDASAIVIQLLDVLAAAHAKGIVHRDIKPANLFVAHDGTVKVLDFGIARARDAAASGANQTGTGMLLGTPAFMPPEQALGQSSLIDGQTDVWAAGATLFALVSGRYVHEGENAPQLMIRAATAHARPVASVVEGVPPAIAAVIDRALAFDKAARWPTAGAMQDALGAAYRTSFGHEPSKGALMAALEAASASAGVPTHSSSELAPTVESRETPYAAEFSAPRPMTPIAPLIPLSGGTTAQPVLSEAAVSVPGVRRSNWRIGAALVVSGLAVTGAGLVVMRGHATATAGSPPESPAGLVVPAAAPPPSSSVASAPAPEPSTAHSTAAPRTTKTSATAPSGRPPTPPTPSSSPARDLGLSQENPYR